MIISHKKNTAFELVIPMVDAGTPAVFKTGLSPTDTAYYKDGEGAWTSLSITDTFSEIASTGLYEISLLAAEMNHDWVIIKVTASGAANTFVTFKMFTGDIYKAAKVLINKAVQTKATGVIVHYDDDDVTPVVTMTPTDGASEITRTPS